MSVGAVNKQTGDRIPTAGMPAIDDALDLTSVNPVQNEVITAALANKQDKTDNSLQTTDKTVVGAINEHEGDISSLMRGLTNYENQNNLNLEVPDRKNLFNKDDADNLTGRALNSETGEPYVASGWMTSSFIKIEPSTNYALTTTSSSNAVAFYDSEKVYISGASTFGTKTTPSNAKYLRFDYKPEYADIMQLELGSTATSYTPYIPSVESRIEAVESDLTGVFKADLLYEGAPTTAETYEEMNLISGKSITDYLLILFICRQYNNTVAFAIEPRHVFTQQKGDSSRVIFKYGDGALQTVMVYYVSPTKIAVNQKTVDGAIWKTALYGIIKQP